MIYDLQAFLRIKVNVQIAFADTELDFMCALCFLVKKLHGGSGENNRFEENNEKAFDYVVLYNKECVTKKMCEVNLKRWYLRERNCKLYPRAASE